MRKAQGISINTIIIAAIALIVLVVLIAIFTGRLGIWGSEMDDALKPTECKPEGTWKQKCDADTETPVYGRFSDAEAGKTCCVPKE